MRVVRSFLVITVLSLIISLSAFAQDIYIDGEKVYYDETTGEPFSENGVILVPLYPTFEVFGNDGITQDNPNGTVVITKGDISVSCNTSEKNFIRNGTKIKASRGLVWKGGPLYVPVEIFSAFDADVYINGSGVIITRNSENTSGIFGSVGDEAYRGSQYFGEKYEPQNGLYLGCFSKGDVLSGINSFRKTYGKEAAAFTVRISADDRIADIDKELRYAAESGKILRIELCGADVGETDISVLSEMAEYLEASGARILLCPAPGASCTHSQEYISDIEKFKNDFVRVSDVFRNKAPSVAMVWQVCSCNFSGSEELYPGDMYVHYAEARLCPKESEGAECLHAFTSAYGYKKPVILTADISGTAFYGSPEACLELCTYLPAKYPSVKAVFFPDLADMERIDGSFLNVIRSGVSSPSYIDDPNSRADDIPYYFEFGNGIDVPASKVRICLTGTSDTAYVIYKLNGEQISSSPVKGMPFEAEPDFSEYAGETVSLEAVMYDQSNKPCGKTSYTVNVGTKIFTDNGDTAKKTAPIVYISAILISLAGIFVLIKKINDIFL